MEGSTDESDGSGGTSTSDNYEPKPDRNETNSASSNSNSSSSSTPLYCTYAITGADRAFHQPIFVCRTCCGMDVSDEPPNPDSDEPQPQREPSPQALRCICESCAEACHEALDHDVEYMGIGPCTCDCGVDVDVDVSSNVDEPARNGNECACLLRESSTRKKEELGIQAPRPPCTTEKDLLGCCVYQLAPHEPLPANGSDLFARLVEEGKALIKHSKETFWSSPHDHTDDNDDDNDNGGRILCALEQMALAIYRLHTEHPHQPCEQPSEREPFGHGGAEWWIQFTPNDECTGGIDLHYDKDETLAEHFNLGSFPAVSTVTYLTAGDATVDADGDAERTHSYQTPTRIFQHAYHDDEETPIARMIESYPVIGKHLAFDGQYLHGAPKIDSVRSTHRDDGASSRGERMTFLVNIWPEGCKPCGSNRLPQHLRDTILSSSNVNVTSALEERIASMLENCTKQDILQRNIQHRDVSAVDRISVPFVSTGATWIDPIHEDDSDEEEGLILTMYPTPPLEMSDHTPTTVCYQWEEGLGPRLEHVYHGNDYDYENEDEVETSVGSLEDANSHTDQAEISSDCYRKQNESILNHMQQNGGIKCVAYI